MFFSSFPGGIVHGRSDQQNAERTPNCEAQAATQEGLSERG
jgi:hypothetical protein